MYKLRFLLSVAVTLFFSLALCSLTQAAPRTFVSGLGSDANPCTREAPCRTFQRAHDLVDDKGEVLALDSAGYGTLTISKNVTISGEEVEATANATTPINAITIATAGLKVVLRSITVEGFGTGNTGISVTAAVNLTIQHCVIHGFTGGGLALAISSGTGKLSLSDSKVMDCINDAVDLVGLASGNVEATIAKTRIENNGAIGLFTQTAKVTIRDSATSGNSLQGIHVTANSEVNVESCESSNNGFDGIFLNDPTAIVRVSRSVVTDNGGYGFNNGGGGTFLSRVDVIQSQNSSGDVSNKIFSNTVEGNTAGNTNGTIGTYSSQ